MKSYIIFITLLTIITSTREKNLKSKALSIIKCLLQSETSINDLNKIIEIIKEGDFLKLILKIIEIYPSIYNEIKKCLNQKINLEKLFDHGWRLGNKNNCCWKNENECYLPPKRFEFCNQAITFCYKKIVFIQKTKKTTKYYQGN